MPVVTGFRKFNVQAVINNLKWGDDHWLYGAGSSNGERSRFQQIRSRLGCRSRYGCKSSGSGDEYGGFSVSSAGAITIRVACRGARFGNTFDDWGHRFICNIRNPIQHIVLPRSVLARNPMLCFLPLCVMLQNPVTRFRSGDQVLPSRGVSAMLRG